MFLDWSSNHPFHCKVAIVYSQALRIHTICSDPVDRQFFLDKLRSKFLKCNYPSEVIQQQFQRATSVNRSDLVWKVKMKEKRKFGIPFVQTYNRYGPPWKKWFNKYKYILELDPKFRKIIQEVRFVNKQPKNLQSLLTSSRLKNVNKHIETNPGCFSCGKNCHTCKVIKNSTKFSSTNTGRSYTIREKSDCKTKFIIYLTTCSKCSGQYVGKTKNSFSIRHSTHKQSIKKGSDGIGEHYKQCGYEKLQAQIIDRVHYENISVQEAEEILSKKEIFWQHQLRTFKENGGNAHCLKKDHSKCK